MVPAVSKLKSFIYLNRLIPVLPTLFEPNLRPAALRSRCSKAQKEVFHEREGHFVKAAAHYGERIV